MSYKERRVFHIEEKKKKKTNSKKDFVKMTGSCVLYVCKGVK